MTEDQKNTIFESVIHSNCLRDNLEIMKGMGLNTGKLKIARNQFHVQLTHYLNRVYSKIGDLKFLNDSMEIDTKIMKSLSILSLEEKEELLNRIQDEN